VSQQNKERAHKRANRGRLLRALAGCCAMAPMVPWAADAPAWSANVQALDKAQAEQERMRKAMEGKPKGYEDKVMDATPLPAAPGPGTSSAPEEGLRSFFSETRVDMGRSESGLALRKSTELGQRLEYRRETLNYGDLLLQADLRRGTGDNLGFGNFALPTQASGERLTVRDIAFPITPGLFADSAVGDINSEITDALARSYRVSLGTSPVRGASTRIYSDSADLRVGFGERGTLAGGPYPAFERGQGGLAWAGFSQQLGRQLFAGVQASRATDVPTSAWTLSAANIDVDSVAATVGYGPQLLDDGAVRTRGIYVRSQTSRDAQRPAQGLFLEGATRTGSVRHEYGAYTADPNLRYGDYVLLSDNRGAYWRMDGSSLRMGWGLGADVQDSNPRHERDRLSRRALGLNANVQYRIDRDQSIGGSAVMTTSRNAVDNGLPQPGADSRSLHASAFYQMRIRGVGRATFRATAFRNETLVSNALPATGEEIEWEQEWFEGNYDASRLEVSTTLGVARDRSNGIGSLEPQAGLNFRFIPSALWSMQGNLHYTASNSNLATNRGLSGTVDAERRLDGGWLVGGSLSLNQAVVQAAGSPNAAPLVMRSNDKFASVYLRWEGSSGTSWRSAGLQGGAGAGSVSGVVYFDANRDGEQQSGEAGVPNVEVLLDGRLRATTDRSGRFAFPLVGTGHHQITLTLETVPLPWGAESGRGVSIDVPLRGVAETRIPVVRVAD
jgi:hypothetical protein